MSDGAGATRRAKRGEIHGGGEGRPGGEAEQVERQPEAGSQGAEGGDEGAARGHGSRYRGPPRGAPLYRAPAGTVTVTPAHDPPPPPGSAYRASLIVTRRLSPCRVETNSGKRDQVRNLRPSGVAAAARLPGSSARVGRTSSRVYTGRIPRVSDPNS